MSCSSTTLSVVKKRARVDPQTLAWVRRVDGWRGEGLVVEGIQQPSPAPLLKVRGELGRGRQQRHRVGPPVCRGGCPTAMKKKRFVI